MSRLLTLCILVLTSQLAAQVTPQPSPGASISQTVGITKVEIDYSRPGVKARQIFGDLVSYGTLWRTGANAPTLFSVSNDVTINGAELKAGTYALLSYPFKKEWVLIFSNNLSSTEETYDKSEDALRIHVESYEIPFTETFTIDLSNIQYDTAFLNFYWENTAITVDLAVNNELAVVKSIDQKRLETAGAFLQASEYFIAQDLDLNKALEYANQSIDLKMTFRNTWVKSRVLREKGNYSEALLLAEKARDLGEDKPIYAFFKEDIDKAIIELKLLTPQN